MKVQQLFYTSCKKGISLGMGFQTYSMSEGITEEERKEIEAHCVYIPPDNLPTQPTKEEIEKLFPIALSSFRLKSGKYCICQSKYVGKDYSGRYGNYFSHVLISDEPWPFYPIELYGSITFRDSLTSQEESAEEIKSLENLEGIHLGNVIDYNTISAFLKGAEGENRRKNFKLLMESVIDYEKEGKNIVFEDLKENNAYWIGAIQMALTKNLAQTFSFTTYCYNPENTDYKISALYKDKTSVNLKSNQKLYKYTYVDFYQNNPQTVGSSFSKLIEVGYTVSKEVLLSFLSFLGQFEYNILDRDIEDCICLYNIVNKGIEKLNIENVKKAIGFANRYKSEDAFSKIFKQIGPNLEKISTQVDIELTEIVSEFLFNMSKETGKRDFVNKAYEFFFDAIHCLVMDREDTDIEDIFHLYKKVRRKEKGSNQEFIKMSLAKSRIGELNTYLQGAKVRHGKFYVKSIIDDIIVFNRECSANRPILLFNIENEEDKERVILLKRCMEILLDSPKDIEEIMCYFKDECEYVADIILMEYIINLRKDKDSLVCQTLAQFLVDEGKKDPCLEKNIYSNICNKPYGMDFMFYIFKYKLSKNIDDNSFFVKYSEEIFDVFTEYRKKKFSQALKVYIDSFEKSKLSLEQYSKILKYIYKNLSYIEVNKKLFEEVICCFEEEISVENVEMVSNAIEEVGEIKSKYKISTPCNITELICIHKKLISDDFKNKRAAIGNFKGDFSYISPSKYEEYLKWILPNLNIYLLDYSDHAKVTKAFLCEEYRDVYYKVYTDTIVNILNEKKYKNMLKDSSKEVYEIFLDYVIFILKNKVDFEENMDQYAEDKIIHELPTINERKMNSYDKYILQRIEDDRNKNLILKEWKNIKKKAFEKSKIRNIMAFFKK
ncbi:hypothetical protein [Clostridium lundense]|uniref:GAP1-N2 domain-containing protein n=1 Tax=Clostridium lundense TaxID=319475 RepID=UPI0004815D35|nr:hypothetical protein [Clostridium lundense]